MTNQVRMIDDNIFTLLVRGIWIVLAVTTAGGLVIGSPKTAFSILVGGLLAIANYYWLLSIMKRALQLTADKAGSFAVMRYLLRLAILAVILGLLIASGSVNIAGLFLGLSVIVITITIIAVYRLTHKEDRA